MKALKHEKKARKEAKHSKVFMVPIELHTTSMQKSMLKNLARRYFSSAATSSS